MSSYDSKERLRLVIDAARDFRDEIATRICDLLMDGVSSLDKSLPRRSSCRHTGRRRMDIADWLQGLGLERYEQTFRDNEIDERVLLKLTADYLKELGVNALGHRRLLLDAIAALSGVEPSIDTGSPAQPADSQFASARSAVAAERRQLTVMFCLASIVFNSAITSLRGLISVW